MSKLQQIVDNLINSEWRRYDHDDIGSSFYDLGGLNGIPDGTLVEDLLKCFQIRFPESRPRWCDTYFVKFRNSSEECITKPGVIVDMS